MKAFNQLRTELNEANEFAVAKKLWASLSVQAQYAIEQWENVGWEGGKLEQHLIRMDDVGEEIIAASRQLREAVGRPRIKLYRGIRAQQNDKQKDQSRLLISWTNKREYAEIFAGLRTPDGKLIYEPITDKEVNTALAKFDKNGYVEFYGSKYVRDKDDPDMYMIFDRNRQPITDGNDLEADLRNEQEWVNSQSKKRGIVIEEWIPTNQLVWVIHTSNVREYIMSTRPIR